MRWSFLLLIAFAAACDWPPASSTSTSTGTTPDAGDCAAGNADCADCQMCAENGPCATDLAACNASPGCLAIMGCAPSCGSDATCLQNNCYASSSGDDVSFYEAYATCLNCTQCTCTGLCSSQ